MFNQKRGLSTVVTITLIMVISIVAVLILWTALRLLFDEVKGEATTSCLTAAVQPVGVCDSATGAVTVSNEGAEVLDGVKLFYYSSNAEDAESLVRDGNCVNIESRARKSCVPTQALDAGFVPTRVEVAAVTGDKVCPISNEGVSCAP